MPGATKTRRPDGRLELTVSQSWLNDALSCPELARKLLEGEVEGTTGPEAELGIAVHEGVALLLQGGTLPDAYDLVTSHASKIKVPSDHKWKNVTIKDLALDCLDTWDRGMKDKGIRSQIIGDIVGVEKQFTATVHDDDRFVINVQGTIDLVTTAGLWDWKFSAKKWQQWEVQRYNLQSTMYTLATYGIPEKPVSFKFGVVNPDNLQTQVVEVTRSASHVTALLDQIQSIAVLVAADLPRWPLAGQDWRCSKKWCPAWTVCRGAHGLDW